MRGLPPEALRGITAPCSPTLPRVGALGNRNFRRPDGPGRKSVRTNPHRRPPRPPSAPAGRTSSYWGPGGDPPEHICNHTHPYTLQDSAAQPPFQRAHDPGPSADRRVVVYAPHPSASSMCEAFRFTLAQVGAVANKTLVCRHHVPSAMAIAELTRQAVCPRFASGGIQKSGDISPQALQHKRGAIRFTPTDRAAHSIRAAAPGR